MCVKDKIIDHVGILTIEREEALNALNPDVLKELNSMLIKLISNHNVDSIIITGAGEKAFIAGADIKLMQSFDKKQARDFGELGQNLTLEIENSPKPVLAAVNGFALGGVVGSHFFGFLLGFGVLVGSKVGAAAGVGDHDVAGAGDDDHDVAVSASAATGEA